MLSIIIPTYNSSKTITDALNSLINQTFENYEIIIIDKLSTDGTSDIIKNYALLNNKINWISEPDNGIYQAMNKGIEMAKGEWLYFMGSDDKIYNSNVLSNVFAGKFENIDVLYGNIIHESGSRHCGEYTIEKLLNTNFSHQAIFIRKSVFNLIGNFNLKYKLWADWDHNLRWFLNSKLKNKWIDLDIAIYGVNGYSSNKIDDVFLNDKNYLFVKYARDGGVKLPFEVRYKIKKEEYFKARNAKRYFLSFNLKISSYFMRFRHKYFSC